jgi:hypothetical protein
MDYFEVSLEGFPTVVYQEVDDGGTPRFTDANGVTVSVTGTPAFLKRSWCASRAAWMKPLPTGASQSELMVNHRVLINLLGLNMTSAILDALEAAAVNMPALKRVLFLLEPAQGGIDIHNPTSQTMLNQLETAGILTPEQATALRGL